jgi:gamma-glutamyl phosphate reductase
MTTTKKTKKETITHKMSKAIDTTKKSITKANEFALSTTEEVVLETITMAGEWQKVTNKALKSSIKLMENQHNLFFDTLETFKFQLLEGKKRFKKIFA